MLRLICLIALLWQIGCSSPERIAEPVGGGEPVGQDREHASSWRPILAGTIVDQAGEPVEGVSVVIHSAIAPRQETGRTSTNEDGKYCFDPCPGGYLLMSSNGGDPTLRVRMSLDSPTLVSADGQSWWEAEVLGRSGLTEKDFVVVPGGEVSGVVLDHLGEPVTGPSLRIICTDPSCSIVRYARADTEGRFCETGLPAGSYKVELNDGTAGYPVIGRIEISADQVTKCILRLPPLN